MHSPGYALVLESLRRAPRKGQGSAGAVITEQAYLALDTLQRRALRESEARLACRQGCTHCCYQLVPSSSAEAQLAANHIVKRWAPTQMDRLAKRLQTVRHTMSQLAREPGMAERYAVRQIACPLLDLREGKCLIYEVRPIACRMRYSTDAEACREARLEGSALVGAKVTVPSLTAVGVVVRKAHREVLAEEVLHDPDRPAPRTWDHITFVPQLLRELLRLRRILHK